MEEGLEYLDEGVDEGRLADGARAQYGDLAFLERHLERKSVRTRDDVYSVTNDWVSKPNQHSQANVSSLP